MKGLKYDVRVEVGFTWFFMTFRNRKMAIKYFKKIILSRPTSEISVELYQTEPIPEQLYRINMWDYDLMDKKEIAKILRKVK